MFVQCIWTDIDVDKLQMKKAAKTVVLYGALQRKKAPPKKKVKQTLETTKEHLNNSGMRWHDVMHFLEWGLF